MATLELSPQAEAIIAGLLDHDVREAEMETGESQVFAEDKYWRELRDAFPSSKYYGRLNAEGQIE